MDRTEVPYSASSGVVGSTSKPSPAHGSCKQYPSGHRRTSNAAHRTWLPYSASSSFVSGTTTPPTRSGVLPSVGARRNRRSGSSRTANAAHCTWVQSSRMSCLSCSVTGGVPREQKMLHGLLCASTIGRARGHLKSAHDRDIVRQFKTTTSQKCESVPRRARI